MKIKIAPNNAGFIDRVLVFNLSDKYIDKLPYQEKGYNILLLTNIDIGFGIDLENNYTYVFENNDYYGPYTKPKDAVTKHCFGKIDGLMSVLDNVRYNKEQSIYEFVFKDFVYSPLQYSVNNLKSTALLLRKTLRTIENPFEFTFLPETDFDENVITNFLIRLNNVFNINNFNPFKKETIFGFVSRVDRDSIDTLSNKIIFNTNKRRHIMVYIPKLINVDDKNYLNLSDNEEAFKKVFTDEIVELTNKQDVLAAKQLFDVDITEFKVQLYKIDLLKHIVAIVPNNIGEIITFILKIDGEYFIMHFNTHTKTYTFYNFQDLSSFGYNIYLDADKKYVCISPSKDIVASNEATDLLIQGKDKTFVIDYSKIVFYYKDTISDLNYINNVY